MRKGGMKEVEIGFAGSPFNILALRFSNKSVPIL
jgi:hypothetical protein